MLKSMLALGLGLAITGAPAAPTTAPPLVKNLGGCFAVSYRFVEDGAHDYEIPRVVEWITVKDKDDKFVVQHYGIYDDPDHPGSPEVMKHFYEEWSSPDGTTWRQAIVGPSGNFRYACVSTSRFGQLQCRAKGAPKPVRDAERADYDLLDRGITLQVTPRGWVQSEVNDKVRSDGTAVATEVGWVEYRRLADDACKAATSAPLP